MNLLVTGGAGFLGSTYIKMVLRARPADLVVNLDALTYAGNLETLASLERNRQHVFVHGDIKDRAAVEGLCRKHHIEAIVNFAAESHVDRSILGAEPFVATNVGGTLSLLEAARAAGVRRFLQVSTDEVYGALGPAGFSDETTPLSPRSPYAASKAAADHLVQSFHHTHGLDVVITRGANSYGPFQFPEKLVPLMILNAMEGLPLPVYGDGLHVRDWIHSEDHCAGIDAVLQKGRTGDVYNVAGGNQRTNLEVVRAILRLVDAPESLIRHVPDRPGHDRRYAMSAWKLSHELGWRPQHAFDTGLADAVTWYRDNPGWSSRVRSGAYRSYYERQYHVRLPATGKAAARRSARGAGSSKAVAKNRPRPAPAKKRVPANPKPTGGGRKRAAARARKRRP